jgi:hypothetical protein
MNITSTSLGVVGRLSINGELFVTASRTQSVSTGIYLSANTPTVRSQVYLYTSASDGYASMSLFVSGHLVPHPSSSWNSWKNIVF